MYNHSPFTVAIHEAGHAVVALKLGQEVSGMELSYIEGKVSGGVTYTPYKWIKNPLYFPSKEDLDIAAMVGVAGQLAEEVILQKDTVEGSINDLEKLRLFGLLTKENLDKSESIVKNNIDLIQKLAVHLLQNDGKLTEQQILEVVN
jgi:Peptidase family M41